MRARVAERLVEAAEALAQHGLALEPVLAVRLEAIASFVERDTEVDAAEHVVQSSPARQRVVHVVGDDRAQPLLRRELDQRVADRGIVRILVIADLNEAALAEDGRERRERLARGVDIPAAYQARRDAVGAAGEREEPVGILADELERRAGFGLHAGELRLGHDAAQAPPADLVLRDEHEMPEVERGQLDAEDRLDAGLVRGVPEAHRAVQAVRVGERERVHAALLRGRDEVVDRGRAVQKAVVRMAVELDVAVGHARPYRRRRCDIDRSAPLRMLYVVMYMGATRTQVYLSAEQRRKIDARRKREGKTMASIVRDALDAYLDRPSSSDVQKILDLTFGSMPDLVVPSRDEWERVRPAARHRRPRR